MSLLTKVAAFTLTGAVAAFGSGLTWQGIFAPAGVAAPVLTHINSEFVKAIHSPDLKPRIEQQDMDPTGLSVAEFTKMYRAELARWTKVARDAGLKAE